ncbi:MAG: hypothetical protein K6D38_09325 [Pseudobutyrivibrio sp.]|nr:hypothetical protein [Pseudobutyrivibrio sp.]
MSIKDEIQGPSGYLKKVRDEYMPDTKKMAELAYDYYTKTCGVELTSSYVMDNADGVLKSLFLAETNIFQNKNNEIMSRVLPYYYAFIYGKKDEKYSETSEKIDALIDIFKKCKEEKYSFDMFIDGVSQITTPIIDTISFSQKQSAKCRVGETLQNHLASIFDICEVPYETQQQKDEGGTFMDFVIPSLSAIEEMPDQVINIECQTTLKDRFRLTTGKSTDAKIKRYLATVTGAGIVTKRDLNDFSVDKVKEIIMDNNVTLVVFKEVKARILIMLNDAREKMLQGKRVQNAAASFEDIERLIKLSDKKIITYSELIKRDINSAKVYWN